MWCVRGHGWSSGVGAGVGEKLMMWLALKECQTSAIFPLGELGLLWLVGLRLPHKHRCVARTMPVLSRAFLDIATHLGVRALPLGSQLGGESFSEDKGGEVVTLL